MYEYITGKLAIKGTDYIVMENNGIGYRVHTSLNTLENPGKAGDEITLHTHLYVREGIMDLYGFATEDELKMFRLLLSVSGIGPRAAVSIISAVRPSGFALAVVSEDVDSLTRAQGIGRKTAMKLIVELKDKISREQFAPGEVKTTADESSVYNEAVSALMVLGYTSLEAGRAVSSVADSSKDLEMTIKKALKYLAGR